MHSHVNSYTTHGGFQHDVLRATMAPELRNIHQVPISRNAWAVIYVCQGQQRSGSLQGLALLAPSAVPKIVRCAVTEICPTIGPPRLVLCCRARRLLHAPTSGGSNAGVLLASTVAIRVRKHLIDKAKDWFEQQIPCTDTQFKHGSASNFGKKRRNIEARVLVLEKHLNIEARQISAWNIKVKRKQT